MSFVNPDRFTTRPEIQGTFGVVASTHWIATAVGMGILERGGNAFDAGVATAFTLQIVEPHLNGPGGDVPIMVHDVKRGRTEVICGQGPAPAGATISYYEGLGLDLIPGTGLLAPCVPGCFDAFMLLLRDYGTMRLEEVLSAAIGYARHGHPLLERASATIATVKDQFLTHWPTSAALWLDQGNVPAPGVMFRNAVLVETYERVLRESTGPGGRDGEIERARRVWSQGFVADAIDRFCRTQEVMDVSGRAHRGVLTGADMAAWSAAVEAPIGYDYGRYRVQKPGPWCQGLVALQQLAILKHFQFDGLDPVGADFIHWQVEAAKLAFADRDTFYGDPDFVTVPVEILLSDAYSAKRQALISERASLDQRPGAIPGHGKMLETRLGSDRTAVGSGGASEPTVGRLGESKGDTVHFDVIDRFGNMVCATPSGGWLQSSPTIPELGFCLGTRAQMFTMDEQHPACLAPGKRPRSNSLTDCSYERRRTLPCLGLAGEGISRTNGSRSSFCAMFMRATISKKQSTRPRGTQNISRRLSGPAPPAPACLSSKTGCQMRPSQNWRNAVISWRSDRTGRRDDLSPPRAKKIA